MQRDYYKPLRQAHRRALHLGRNREERRLLLHGKRYGFLVRAYARMATRPKRHRRRNRIKGC